MHQINNQPVRENFPLKNYNTFGIEAYARFYYCFSELIEIKEFINIRKFLNLNRIILGGGSNILFTKNFDGLVIQPLLRGIKINRETDSHLLIEASAGEPWDDFVKFCVDRSLYGVENLSLIPGSVGAAPIQNIGAYGAEVRNVIEAVHGIDLRDGQFISYKTNECRFDYRSSIFKHDLKNNFLISSVTFRLMKKAGLKIDYVNLLEEVGILGGATLQNVRQAVINIRQSKLPDPAVTGNAGSFFKNPVIKVADFEELKSKYPDAPFFKASDGYIKIPAGWLIEKCGWKGKTVGNAGIHAKQALIIVNNGKATGKEILELSEAISQSVYKVFKISLEREVNII